MPIDLQGLEEIQRKLKTLESSLGEAGIRRKLNTVGGGSRTRNISGILALRRHAFKRSERGLGV